MISSMVVIQARSQSAPSPDRSASHGEVTIEEEWAKQWRSPMLSIMNSDTAIAQQISQQRREGQKRNQQTLYERLVTESIDGYSFKGRRMCCGRPMWPIIDSDRGATQICLRVHSSFPFLLSLFPFCYLFLLSFFLFS